MAEREGRLAGKVAVITGGGNGIGRATAVRFAEEGARVVVADLLAEPGNETVAAVEAVGGEAVFVPVDVTSRIDNDSMARTAFERFGSLDVVLTAAGISSAGYVSGDMERYVKIISKRREMTPAQAFVDLDRDEFQEVMEVNLTGTMLSLQACLAAMLDNQCASGSSLITIASIAAKHPDAGSVPYGTSKAAVWYLTKILARQLAAEGIRVNSIGPGFIKTNMTSIIDLGDSPMRDRVYSQIPMGRMGEPRDIANAALFLASEESSYMTGEILHPDGGFYTE